MGFIMLKKNQEREAIVSAIGMDGEGVIIDDGVTVFVPYTLVGEKVKYRVLKVTTKCAYGKAIEIITPANERVKPRCPVFGKCGGCRLQHAKYDEQLKIKENKVEQCFRKIAGIELSVSPTVKDESGFRYRNKLQLPVGETSSGTVFGFYAENSHRIVPIDDCPINGPWTKNVISAFKKYMSTAGLKGYSEENRSGDIREITVKEIDGSLIITVVALKRSLPQIDMLISSLKENLKTEFSLFLNYNPADTNVVYGENFYLLYGPSEYSSEISGVKFNMGVKSFMQVNTSVCSKLYEAVVECSQADENTTVIDAYSGCGVMTALLAKRAKKAIGIEIIKEATEIADKLAERNGMKDKIVNHCAKCEDALPDIIARERAQGSKITVVLDPPRKGCDVKVINAVINSGADRIVYVSCKPSTLARDVGLLIGTLEFDGREIKREKNPARRYEIETVQPFDMFPQTKHVETLCVLTCKNYNI